MSDEAIRDKVIGIIAEILFCDKKEIKQENFSEIPDLDSLSLSLVLEKTESDFNVKLKTEDLFEIASVGELVNYLSKLL